MAVTDNIAPSYTRTGHLHSTIPYLDLKDPISRPGCWACAS
jgi:hypothetical protein